MEDSCYFQVLMYQGIPDVWSKEVSDSGRNTFRPLKRRKNGIIIYGARVSSPKMPAGTVVLPSRDASRRETMVVGRWTRCGTFGMYFVLNHLHTTFIRPQLFGSI